MQNSCIRLNNSKFVHVIDGNLLKIIKRADGDFEIDRFIAHDVFVLEGGERSFLYASGVNSVTSAISTVSMTAYSWEIIKGHLYDLPPPTPNLSRNNSLEMI